MADKTGLYKVLECNKDATQEWIRKQFQTLAKKYHPDKSELENSTEIFQKINNAYSVLGDPNQRAEYDRRVGHQSKHYEIQE